MWSTLLLVWLVPYASAEDCSAKVERLRGASPVAVAEAFIDLAACDPDLAAREAAAAIPRVVAASDADDAMVAAIKVGASSQVSAWIDAQEPDAQSRAIGGIGKACPGNEAVASFFTAAASERGDAFWEERWHRGLKECRYPAVQALLTGALEGSVVGRTSRNRSGYFDLLEVYARNLGEAAIPTLSGYLGTARDEEEQVFLVSAFADAANVGGTGGMDAKAAAASVAALQAAGPTLSYKGLDRARGTLLSLGAPTEASGLAQHAFKELRVDGLYTYGLVAVEEITCANGKRRGVLHVGSFTEPGKLWPDELMKVIDAKVREQWSFDAAARCKGTSTVSIKMTDKPLAVDALKGWQVARTEEFQSKFADAKVWIVAEEGFGY